MTLPIGLILEALVALLLLLTLVYCFILDRRLKELRSGQDGLRQLVEALDTATNRAQQSIGLLRQASEGAANDLRETVGPARALADELSLMIESGNNLADRLEGRRQAMGGTGAEAAAKRAQAPRTAAAPAASEGHTRSAPAAAPAPSPAADDTDEAYENRLLKALRDAR